MKGQHSEIPTPFIQAIRDTAMEAVKASLLKKDIERRNILDLGFDQRTMSLRGEQLKKFAQSSVVIYTTDGKNQLQVYCLV